MKFLVQKTAADPRVILLQSQEIWDLHMQGHYPIWFWLPCAEVLFSNYTYAHYWMIYWTPVTLPKISKITDPGGKYNKFCSVSSTFNYVFSSTRLWQFIWPFRICTYKTCTTFHTQNKCWASFNKPLDQQDYFLCSVSKNGNWTKT